MTHFVKLTRPNGDKAWVNSDLVIVIERAGDYTEIAFAVAGMVQTDGPNAYHYPFAVRVTESPADVAGRMLPPAGPR